VRGRVVLCGGISQYNTTTPKGPSNYLVILTQRVRMEGFIVMDYQKQYSAGACVCVRVPCRQHRPTRCCASLSLTYLTHSLTHSLSLSYCL
jgi:hypothetical protein